MTFKLLNRQKNITLEIIPGSRQYVSDSHFKFGRPTDFNKMYKLAKSDPKIWLNHFSKLDYDEKLQYWTKLNPKLKFSQEKAVTFCEDIPHMTLKNSFFKVEGNLNKDKGINKRDIVFVHQREAMTQSLKEKERFVATGNIQRCVALYVVNNKHQTISLTHIDPNCYISSLGRFMWNASKGNKNVKIFMAWSNATLANNIDFYLKALGFSNIRHHTYPKNTLNHICYDKENRRFLSIKHPNNWMDKPEIVRMKRFLEGFAKSTPLLFISGN